MHPIKKLLRLDLNFHNVPEETVTLPLQEELMLLAFSYLKLSELLTASHVCRRWRRIARTPGLGTLIESIHSMAIPFTMRGAHQFLPFSEKGMLIKRQDASAVVGSYYNKYYYALNFQDGNLPEKPAAVRMKYKPYYPTSGYGNSYFIGFKINPEMINRSVSTMLCIARIRENQIDSLIESFQEFDKYPSTYSSIVPLDHSSFLFVHDYIYRGKIKENKVSFSQGPFLSEEKSRGGIELKGNYRHNNFNGNRLKVIGSLLWMLRGNRIPAKSSHSLAIRANVCLGLLSN